MISVIILSDKSTDVPKKTLNSLAFCDEILYIPVNGDFAEARNEGMKKTKNEWILFVDSDEVVSEELRNQISHLRFEMTKDTQAYSISRRDFFWGKELKWGETHSARTHGIIRLVRKGSGNWRGAIHETFQTEKRVGKLHGFIDHYPHQTIASFLASINEYSTMRAMELWSNGTRTNVFQILLYPFGKFWYTYLVKLGFLDGQPGFVYSFMMSFHSFLVRGKLYLRTLKVQNRPL